VAGTVAVGAAGLWFNGAMIVRWGLGSLGAVLAELGVERPLLISSERWSGLELPVARRFHGAQPHAEGAGVAAAVELLGDADGLVALGGGSAIDTAKAVSAQSGLSVVSVPTTYSGAEWTTFFGVRDAAARVKGGGGGARTLAVIYDPALTIGLSRSESGGTAMNALAHCAEALYTREHSESGDAAALSGAALIGRWLPGVLADGDNLEARRGLLEGAARAGEALCAGMGVAHAMAQALGGRYGLAHGTMNAICLPPALRFNGEVAAEPIVRLGSVLGGEAGAAARCEELAALVGVGRLRDHGVPREELAEIAAAVVVRPAALANPRPVDEAAVAGMLEEIW
jgi:maleylacetate reductase